MAACQVLYIYIPWLHVRYYIYHVAFRKLKFAVVKEMNISGKNLHTLVTVVATATLSDNICKVFTLYLTGHGDLLWNVISKHDNYVHDLLNQSTIAWLHVRHYIYIPWLKLKL